MAAMMKLKHKRWLFNKLDKAHDNYIKALFRYFGYEPLTDVEVITMLITKKLMLKLETKKTSEKKKKEFIDKKLVAFFDSFNNGKFELFRKTL